MTAKLFSSEQLTNTQQPQFQWTHFLCQEQLLFEHTPKSKSRLILCLEKKKSMPRAAPHPRYVSQNTFADALYRKKAGCNKLALAPRCGGNGSPPQVGLCGAMHHVFHRRHLASITRSSCTQQAGRLFIVRLCPRGGSAALGQESKTKCLGDLRLESDLQILELEQNMMRRHEREKLLFSVKATGQV